MTFYVAIANASLIKLMLI